MKNKWCPLRVDKWEEERGAQREGRAELSDMNWCCRGFEEQKRVWGGDVKEIVVERHDAH